MKIIDGDALYEEVEKAYDKVNSFLMDKELRGSLNLMLYVEDAFDNAPVLDVIPVVKAHLIEERNRNNHWHCSKCHTVYGIACQTYNYCPNCGSQIIEKNDG